MDFSTGLMMLISFAVVLYGIGLDNLGNFWDPDSLFITIGGSLAILIASTPFKRVKNIPKHFKVLSRKSKDNPIKCIEKIVSYSQEARQKGLLALDAIVQTEEDPFLRSGLMLVVDGTDPEKVQTMLEDEINHIEERHAEAWEFYDKGAALGPAFGMIGTLIGLINMLKSMSDMANGANDLGPAMSVALITTMYGSMLANMVFTPLSNKLKAKHQEEMFCKEICMAGVLAIQFGENPKNLENKLLTYLSESERAKASKEK
jgi:chemotaxis protein MotA